MGEHRKISITCIKERGNKLRDSVLIARVISLIPEMDSSGRFSVTSNYFFLKKVCTAGQFPPNCFGITQFATDAIFRPKL